MKITFRKKNRPCAPSSKNETMMDNFFDDFCLAQAKSEVARNKYDTSSYSMNVADKGDHYEVKVDLPGVKKKHIDVKYNNGVLSIATYKKGSCVMKGPNFLKKEESYSHCAKSVKLGPVDETSMKVMFKDGVLEVSMDKQSDER